MKYSILIFILALVPPLSIFAQNNDIQTQKDSSIAEKLHNNGHFDAKIRNYTMATTNAGHLSDYYAVAIGGSLHYESPVIAHFLSVEMGGMFIYNIASSDLGKPDSTTQVKDRYEIALFDLENPANRSHLDRMNEFNVRFHFSKKSKITLGRQVINSPLINPQDGRMRPSLMSGAWLNIADFKNTKIQGGWLWAAAPRSTVRWFSTAESIGVYSNGVTTTGAKATYFMNLESKGVFVLGLNTNLTKNWTLSTWNYLLEHISNTIFVQTDFEHPLSISGKKGVKIKAALQIIHQDAVKDGGNSNPLKTYMEPNSKANVFGGRVGLATPQSQLFLNYTRITADGRFNFPREWGRDPLLTFMTRERNEGAGDVSALNIVLNHSFLKKNTQLSAGFGYFKMPDVKDYRLNKYGMPSYTQLNISVKYRFKGLFKNAEMEALIAQKWNQGQLYANDRYRINKVDMTNYNLILNYGF